MFWNWSNLQELLEKYMQAGQCDNTNMQCMGVGRDRWAQMHGDGSMSWQARLAHLMCMLLILLLEDTLACRQSAGKNVRILRPATHTITALKSCLPWKHRLVGQRSKTRTSRFHQLRQSTQQFHPGSWPCAGHEMCGR